MSFTCKTPKLRFPEFRGEWVEKKLKNITSKIGSGSTPRGGDKVYQSYGVPFIRSQNINVNKLFLDDVTYISETINDAMKNSIVQGSDILLNITGASIGRSCVVPSNFEVGNVNQHVCIIRLDNKNNPYFLQPLLASHTGQKLIYEGQTGSGREGLNFQSIASFKFNLPSKSEQEKIASFLTAVDAKIEQLTRKAKTLEKYKKSVMQKLFSQELRFTCNDGSTYPEWKEKKLGEIFEYKNGGAFENDVVNNGKYNLITLNSIDIQGTLKTEHKTININNYSLDKNDLIMVLSDVAHGNFLGLTAIIPENNKYVLNQRMGALKIKTQDNIEFIRLLINFNQKYFKLCGQGSSQQNLSKGDILKFIINLPSLPEQTKIANFLSAIDEKLLHVKTQIEQTKQFKKALLQQMFV